MAHKRLALVAGCVSILAIAVTVYALFRISSDHSPPTAFVGGASEFGVSPKHGGTSKPTSPLPVEASISNEPQRPGFKESPPPTQTRTPDRGTTGLAAQIEARANFNRDVYMNSEIALADFERQRLRLPDDEQFEWFAGLLRKWGKEVRMVDINPLLAQWNDSWLFEHRPVFSVDFHGAQPGTRVKLTLRTQDRSARRLLSGGQATESEWVTLDEGQPYVWWIKGEGAKDQGHWEVMLSPRWNIQEVHKLAQPEEIDVGLDIHYQDGSDDERQQRAVRLYPISAVEMHYPNQLGFAGLVDENHPYIATILNTINQSDLAKRNRWSASGGVSGGELTALFLVWQELQRRGLRYSSLPGGAPDWQFVRPIHETLCDQNANCIDGTVLLCSFIEKMGFESWIALPPGHAFAVMVMQDADDDACTPLGIETTLLGSDNEDWQSIAKQHPPLLRWLAPQAQRIESRLKGSEVSQFRRFLRAIAAGTVELIDGMDEWQNGSSAKELPSIPELVKIYNDPQATMEQTDEALFRLQHEYLKVISIGKFARRNGILPVGHNPEMLAKFPLKR